MRMPCLLIMSTHTHAERSEAVDIKCSHIAIHDVLFECGDCLACHRERHLISMAFVTSEPEICTECFNSEADGGEFLPPVDLQGLNQQCH